LALKVCFVFVCFRLIPFTNFFFFFFFRSLHFRFQYTLRGIPTVFGNLGKDRLVRLKPKDLFFLSAFHLFLITEARSFSKQD
jgi:hypothetical protein